MLLFSVELESIQICATIGYFYFLPLSGYLEICAIVGKTYEAVNIEPYCFFAIVGGFQQEAIMDSCSAIISAVDILSIMLHLMVKLCHEKQKFAMKGKVVPES